MPQAGALAGGDNDLAALPAVIDTLDDLPDTIKEHYEQDGEVYRLRVDGYDDTGLKQTLEDTKAKLRKAREKLEGVPDDFDKAELEELRKLRQNLEDEKARAAGDWEKLKESMEKRHAKERESLSEALSQTTQQLEQIIKRDAATAALADHGALVQAMMPHVLERVQIVEEDGARKAVAKGLDGEPTDIPSLVEQMKASTEEWGWGFKPNGAAGGGSSGTGGAGRAGQIRTKADLGDPETNPAAHAHFISEHGLEAYRALPRG